MALGFNIEFLSQSQFQFVDTSNTSDYSALSTLKTRLEIIHPLISDNTAVEVNLFDENITTLTDNYVIETEVETQLGSLTDGLYQIDLVLYDDSGATNEVGRVTNYFVQDYSIQRCIATLAQENICDCDVDWCLISRLDALLNSAKYLATQGEWENAQEIVNYLTEECVKINCAC